MTTGLVVGQQVAFYISNNCPFPIWPATASNTGQPVIENGGFFLAQGKTRRIYAPPTWSGRIWARTGCDFSSSSSNGACKTGDCGGKLECNGLIGMPPATLVQVALQADKSKPSFYDVSVVDGYNLPVSVGSKPSIPKCRIGGCSKNMNSMCPEELQVVEDGAVVACKSACLAFDLDVFCCRNAYGTPDKCKATRYSKMFKDACPSYFSYAYDSPSPLVNCYSKEYVVDFCPSKWGLTHSHVLHDSNNITSHSDASSPEFRSE
ncbi:hypothetical protein ACLOJK_028573 [Asimina triloba]